MAILFLLRSIVPCATIEVLSMKRDNAKSDPDRPKDATHPGAVDQGGLNRRRFLEAAGFSISLAAIGGCRRAPRQIALPFPIQPPGVIPGQMRYYASTCEGCSASCGLLVGTRDGRPLKMEGMPEHPLSGGGLCAVGQAVPMELYDSQRLMAPLRDGKTASWFDIDQEIIAALRSVREQKKSVRFVSSTITSPTLQATIDSFLGQFADAKHITLDAVSSSAILDAHEQTHGSRLLPHYRLERAEVLVSFGADFLGTWISPVEYTAAWRDRRIPTVEHPAMSYHVQFEGRMSLTGSNADRRIQIRPEEQRLLLEHLASNIAILAGDRLDWPLQPDPPLLNGNLGTLLDEVAERLWKAKNRSLVLSDSQDVDEQILVNYINHLLGSYGATIDLERPSRQRQGNDREVAQLLEDLKAGNVGALLVARTDLTHNLPDRASLLDAIGHVPLIVSFAEREDDFASLARFVCPDHRPLESWSDAEPIDGLVSLAQPTLNPQGKTRSILESLALWSSRRDSAYDIVRAHWRGAILPRCPEAGDFQQFWDETLQKGFVHLTPRATRVRAFDKSVLKPPRPAEAPDGFSLVLYTNVAMPESRHAHNPWLQELPDPVTKVTWGNYVSLSPHVAAELGLKEGDVLEVNAEDAAARIELPLVIQPGQHDRVLAIALAYGCKGTERFAGIGPEWLEARPTVQPGERVGKNAARFLHFQNGSLRYSRDNVTLRKTAKRRQLAATQEHHAIEVPPDVAPHGAARREIIQETTLAAFTKNPEAGAAEVHYDPEAQLWPEDHPKKDHHWGMVIDLNACTGCSACMIACQSENNVPVVGADEVRRHREMHWLRIDRYYEGEDAREGVAHQPMLCQHCDNAPCETVCPVLATVHSSEGLNEQIYNRCVGTRYCANNCPYKVRRFNWFEYAHDDLLQNLALNPDVTVRSRGVMEKCSMCVQRIEEARIAARSAGVPLADGDVQTACQQSCPARAIVFGDMNDLKSEIHAAQQNPRRYRVLEELNVRPSVSYLRVVKNQDEQNEKNKEA